MHVRSRQDVLSVMVCIKAIFFAFSISLFTIPCDSSGELLIRKCCHEWEELNSNYTTCVDRLGNYDNGPWPSDTKCSVAEVRESEGSADFPWWMDNATKPLDPNTFNTHDSFLDQQDDSKYIEFGMKFPCDHHMVKAIPSKRNQVKLLHNGTIIYQNISFSPASYCVDVIRLNKSRAIYAYFICPCLEIPCIRKCCKPGYHISINVSRRSLNYHCDSKLDSSTSFIPRMYYENLTQIEGPLPAYILYDTYLSSCPEDRNLVAIEPENTGFWRFPNGSVLTTAFGKGVPFEPQHTCGDLSVINANKTLVENLFVCAEKKRQELPTVTASYYISLYLVGAVFMTLTLLVFAIVPETRKNNLKYIVCHTAVQLPAHVVLAVGHFYTVVPHSFCITIPFIIQFSFLAAFFWLNVMCIDISWAFSGFRPPQGSVSERDRKKFIYYSLYAWGSPTIIFIVTAIMEFVKDIPDTYLKPDFGIKACWFREKTAAFAYFYGPMAALLLANFILFVYTTVKIIQVQRDTRILHNGESGRHDGSNFKKDKKRLILYAKLFCLMGLTWITEIISWLHHDSPQYYWYVTDAINLLRAVFIFIIFCCKRKVYRLLKQRLFPSFVAENNASQSNGTRKSSSSTQNSILPPIPMSQLNKNGKVADKTPPENP